MAKMFDRFTEAERKALSPFIKRVAIEEGETLFKEGEPSEEIYFIESGSVEIFRENHLLTALGAGDSVGEASAVLQHQPRSITVVGLERTEFTAFDLASFKKSPLASSPLNDKIAHLLVETMAEKLDYGEGKMLMFARDRLSLAETRLRMGQFLVCFLIAISVFFFVVKVVASLNLHLKVHTFISIPLIFILFSFVILFIQISSYPLTFFGLTWKHGWRATGEALLWSPVILLILVGVKWLLIEFVPDLHNEPLFKSIGFSLKKYSVIDQLAVALAYPIFVPLQELIARGFMQGCLENFLIGKNRVLLSIVLSNLMFSTLHLQFSLQLALVTLFLGFFWGWLYTRHHTLVGVTVSHIIVGLVGFLGIGLF